MKIENVRNKFSKKKIIKKLNKIIKFTPQYLIMNKTKEFQSEEERRGEKKKLLGNPNYSKQNTIFPMSKKKKVLP